MSQHTRRLDTVQPRSARMSAHVALAVLESVAVPEQSNVEACSRAGPHAKLEGQNMGFFFVWGVFTNSATSPCTPLVISMATLGQGDSNAGAVHLRQ